MDPRVRRSRQRLHSAALEFAAAGRIDDVSVSELSRSAGLTRDTFYRHAATVPDLVAEALALELEALAAPYNDSLFDRTTLAESLRRAERDLLRHAAERAAVYTTALGSRNSASVKVMLTAFLRQSSEVLLALYPEMAPLPPSELDALTVAMLAEHAAAGTVGAIEVWLRSGEVDDLDRAARAIHAGAPTWWTKLLYPDGCTVCTSEGKSGPHPLDKRTDDS